jgi:uncharacterized LabA/DUF88 family protein
MEPLARCALLIDGAHYDRIRTTFNTKIDFVGLAHLLSGTEEAIDIRYYRDVRDDNELERFASLRAALEWSGIDVIGRSVPLGSPAPRQRYGTNLLQMVADACRLRSYCDTLFLMPSDVQLEPVIATIREEGLRVVVVSTRFAPPSIAPHQSLIASADKFVELRDILSEISLN